MKTFREQIIETIDVLIEGREMIFGQIVNLAMSNELKELNDLFYEGESYSFSLNHFENMEDENIQILVELYKKTEETLFRIMNINGINDEEVNLKESNGN